MKLINKIILGALLFTSSTTAMAQGKSNNNGKKTVTVKTHSSTGSTSSNEHANVNGQINASDRSILNRPTTVRMKKNSKYYKTNDNRKYYYKNGKRYTYRSYVRRAA